ncbi:Lymphocyte antigen 6 complex locus protein G6f [Dissostichus eleginoides]|uniref:Lymphocyte antigen 6 complex locus protein G6f n=1 Tax=Dissostichus eleginoides TaxID=100907 RepID=A0AAD9BW12_DISEL|nr:Lymphocyte antigen 6 complex locus protein G6f [Dissostichus eleginoides]
MSEFRRIIMSSFLMLLLHFPAADVKDNSRIVRVGDEVTLPFDNVIHDQDKCENTTWLFSGLRSSAAVALFEDGQIQNDAKAKRDRLRVIKNCSLVINKVTEEDVGVYFCRQFRSGKQQGPDSRVDLSVVTITEHQDNDETFRPQSSGWWWWIIVVIVGVAALTIITVAVIRRKRSQGTDTQTDENLADPEDGVSYASISYTRKSSRAHLHDDDEDDAVTYSTVRAPSSSSAASTDPSLLKPRKKPM